MTKTKRDRSLISLKVKKLNALLSQNEQLKERYKAVRKFSSTVRISEYHITNACNIRCKGCWFFEYDFDKKTRENISLAALREFINREKERKINAALLIGGEPALFLNRLACYVEAMKYVTVSTNGYKRIPHEGFENLMIGLTLFGGGKLDDEMRAIKPGGKKFTGLFDTVLDNFYQDARAGFNFLITEKSLPYVSATVQRIHDNGNVVNFCYYSEYGSGKSSIQLSNASALQDLMLEMKQKYPDTVLSHPYYINTIVSGKSHFGEFGYDVCPSISVDFPKNKERLGNGNPYLPLFNTYAADLKTVERCCTSGHCDECRDSQAVLSWLMMSMDKFLDSAESLTTWVELAEAYWSLFYWSPYHYTKRDKFLIPPGRPIEPASKTSTIDHSLSFRKAQTAN